MANVTFEDDAFRDPRFAVLGALLGTSKFDARGRMLEVWSYCTEECTYFVRSEVLDALLDKVGAGVLMQTAELATKVEDGSFRILGTKGRVEWLKRLRKNAKKGGEANKAKLAAGGKPTGKPVGYPPGYPEGYPTGQPSYSYPDSYPEGLSGEELPEGEPAGKPAGSQAPLKLEPVAPKQATAVTQLRAEFTSWFKARYGAEYAWGKTEAGKASQLIKRAGAGGPAEVMRRAKIAGAQAWRSGNVSLGVLLGAWNDLASAVRAAPPPERFVGNGSRGTLTDAEFRALERNARELGLIDADGNPT